MYNIPNVIFNYLVYIFFLNVQLKNIIKHHLQCIKDGENLRSSVIN